MQIYAFTRKNDNFSQDNNKITVRFGVIWRYYTVKIFEVTESGRGGALPIASFCRGADGDPSRRGARG